LSAAPSNTLSASLRLFFDIARLRRGPEDVPVSAALLIATLVAYCLLSVVLTLALSSESTQVVAPLAVEVVLALLWIAVVLRLARKPERFMQTATAFFGFQLVLAPLVTVTLALMASHGQDPTWQVPVLLLVLALVGWTVTVSTRIFVSATGWPVFLCIALVVLQALAIRGVLLALFPEVAPAVADAV
jgi:hypothetical protein